MIGTRFLVGKSAVFRAMSWGVSLSAAFGPLLSLAEEPKPAEPVSLNPEQIPLELLVGLWEIVETHFDEQGKVAATTKGQEDIRWILDHRAIQRNYSSGTDPDIFRAVGTFAYSVAEKLYVGVWFNNLPSASPTILKGVWDAPTRTYAFTSESSNKDAKAEQHKIVEKLPDSKTRLVTTYVLKGGVVVKTSEARCTRKSPCPSSIRVIFDDR